MRSAIILSTTVVATLMFASAASAGPVAIGTGGAVRLLPGQIQAGYRQNLEQLRQQAIAQQQRDGGTLTEDHQAAIQRHLDRINDNYKRVLANQNPLGVNADGSSLARGTVPTNWNLSALMRTGTLN